jgi:hypothetical protein
MMYPMLYSIFNKIVLNYEIDYKTFTISKEQMNTKKENK